MENTKDYKVELKPLWWDIKLGYSEYSDYEERHLYFHANNKEEVWNFLCRYIQDVYDKSKTKWCEIDMIVDSENTIRNINDHKFYSCNNEDYNECTTWRVEIEILKVVHFRK